MRHAKRPNSASSGNAEDGGSASLLRSGQKSRGDRQTPAPPPERPQEPARECAGGSVDRFHVQELGGPQEATPGAFREADVGGRPAARYLPGTHPCSLSSAYPPGSRRAAGYRDSSASWPARKPPAVSPRGLPDRKMKSGVLFRPPRTRRAIRIVAFIDRRIGAAICGRPCLLRRYLIKELLSANITMTQSNAQRGAPTREEAAARLPGLAARPNIRSRDEAMGASDEKVFLIDGVTGSDRRLTD